MISHKEKMVLWEEMVEGLRFDIEGKRWELEQLQKRLEILKKIPPLDEDNLPEVIPHEYIRYSCEFNDGHDMLPNV